jgi:hypothetical protein
VSASWDEIEMLLDRLQRLGDPAVREDARALLGLLMRLHAEALGRMLDVARRSGQGGLLDAWKADPQVSGLLLLHGLHPDDLASRVRLALADAVPVATFLGVEVVVEEVSEGEVRLALRAVPGVPAAALAELRGRVEAAVAAAAPEVRAVRFAGGPRRVGLPVV